MKKLLTLYFRKYIIKIVKEATILWRIRQGKGENMADNMTDKQFEKILKMVEMILDGCKDLDEAKAKVKELTEDQKKEKSAE